MASDSYSACELVARVAEEVYAMVMECAIYNRQRVAGEVGTRLGQIAQESFVGYELDDMAEEAAARLLHTLLQICMFPAPAGDQIIPSQDYMRIVLLARPEQRTRLKKQTKGRRGAVKFEDASSDQDEKENRVSGLKQVSSDYFCQVLEHPLFAKLKLNLVHGIGLVTLPPPTPLERFLCAGQGLQLSMAIQGYKVTDKDKIILAHAIAHSFWQFYGSDFMRHRWTSHDIWFMHEMDGQQNPKDQLALRAYMSLNFDEEVGVPEKPDEPMITHPYPHILGLGIILLEIGLARPFKSMTQLPLTSRLNRDHGAAKQLLCELEQADWARPLHRDIFTRAIAKCLDPSIFTTVSGPKSTTKRSSTAISLKSSCKSNSDTGADDRRRKLYDQVVEPLAKLVNIAFKADPRHISYLARCKEDRTSQDRIQSQMASFHTGKTIVPLEWLGNLKHISLHIMKLRRQKPGHKFSPVRIAILDTGCDADLPFFKNPSRANCIAGWRDFVSETGEDTVGMAPMEDAYGHGSLMARLAMEAAPLAHIYIARVARNTNELVGRSGQIAQAIRWAGLEEEVDIVSMSFGFPHDDDTISRAIEDVERDRNIIFLASAGNNAAYQREAFPARHRSVISIRATNCEGTFSASNPPIIDLGANSALGTFGDDLPSRISDEISTRFGFNICQPGTSIATAVAAGIVASTIAYADVLSTVLPIPTEQSPVQSLKKMEGIVRLLEKMAPDQTGHHRFVNPIWFWSEKADVWRAWAAIYDAVSPFMYR
ncbi:hypothetical protein ACHAPA_004541 [Fusarium lateritium]